MVANDFGTFLHNIRIRQKGTTLAKNAGISYVYLLDIEKGSRPVPSNAVLIALADHLQFKDGEREIYFNLAASEKGQIPVDIAAYLGKNRELLNIIRRLEKFSPSKEYWGLLEHRISNDFEGE